MDINHLVISLKNSHKEVFFIKRMDNEPFIVFTVGGNKYEGHQWYDALISLETKGYVRRLGEIRFQAII